MAGRPAGGRKIREGRPQRKNGKTMKIKKKQDKNKKTTKNGLQEGGREEREDHNEKTAKQ